MNNGSGNSLMWAEVDGKMGASQIAHEHPAIIYISQD